MAETTTYGPINPQVNVPAPGSVPNFKPSGEGLTGISGLGTALKGLGDLVGNVTQGVDAIIKSNITGDTENEVDPQRKKMLDDLEATYGTQAVGQLLRPGEKSAGMRAGAPMEATQPMTGPQFPAPEWSESMTPEGLVAQGPQLPKDINDLPGKLNSIYNARNDGHISETYYWGRLSDIASDIRSRYPRGYRNYIDNKIQEITGRDPANAYIESLIRDINTNLGDKNKDRDKLLAEFYQGNLIGRPGVTNMVNGLQSGRVSVEEGVNFLGKLKTQDAMQETHLKNFQEAKARKEDASDAAARYANSIAPMKVNEYFRGIQTINGNEVLNIRTPEDLNRLAMRYKEGNQKLDAKTGVFLATQVSAWIQAADRAIDEDFQKNGVYQAMANDPQKIKQIKDLHLEPLKQLQEAFFKGDTSAVANITNMNTAAHDDFANKMLNDKDFAWNSLALKWLKTTVGDQGAAELLARGPLQGILNSFDAKSKAIMAQMLTPDQVGKSLGGKDYTSLVKGIDAINSGAADLGMGKNHPQVIKTYDQLFQMIEEGLASKDLKPESKIELFKSVFGEENRNVLRKIAPDRPDPIQPNKVVPGYQTLFYRLTRSDIAEAAWNSTPEVRGMYLNWIQTAVREDLFKPELTRLGEQLRGVAASNNYKVVWDTNSKTLRVKVENQDLSTQGVIDRVSADRGSGQQEAMGELRNLLNTQSSLNKGLMGMANAAKGLGLKGDDIDGFVLEQLVAAGVPGINEVGGMPAKVKAAINAAYLEQKNKIEDAKKKQSERDKLYTSPDYEPPKPNPGAVKTISYRPTVTNPADER